MKIIFLNAWQGKMRGALSEFIQEQSKDTDIFCFQEAHGDMVTLCQELLPMDEYNEITASKFISKDAYFAQATYIRKHIRILSSTILLQDQTACGLGIYTHIQSEGHDIHICNTHGTAYPGDKMDTPGRLQQSSEIIEFLKDKKGIKIIGGDFNLSSETKSVHLFEENGYRNLISEYDIDTTRNRLSWENYADKQYYADYVFVGKYARITEFSVPKNEVSDHLPLIVTIG